MTIDGLISYLGEFSGDTLVVLSENDIKDERCYITLNELDYSVPEPQSTDGEDRCEHGMFFSGMGACPQCGGAAELH